jgi:hypothetical protein
VNTSKCVPLKSANLNRRLAIRDCENAKPWEASHHPDGELYHRLLLEQLVDAGIQLREELRRLAVSARFSMLLVSRKEPSDIKADEIPVFTLLIWLTCPFLPDSPRLLIRKGKHEEALEVLAALEGNGATPDSSQVRRQYDIIKDVLDRESAVKYTWWQLLTGRGPSGVVRRMILGAWMQAMNQISMFHIT